MVEGPVAKGPALRGPEHRSVRRWADLGGQVGRQPVASVGASGTARVVGLGGRAVEAPADLGQRLAHHDPAPQHVDPVPRSAAASPNRRPPSPSTRTSVRYSTLGMASAMESTTAGAVGGLGALDPRLADAGYGIGADHAVVDRGVHHHPQDDGDLRHPRRWSGPRRSAPLCTPVRRWSAGRSTGAARTAAGCASPTDCDSSPRCSA